MVQFIDDHRDAYGVESICTVVPIAPSTYFWHKARHADPTRRSARVQRDDEWRREIQRVWAHNQQVYGPRKVWRQLRREGHRVARCTVGRLMRAMGLRGAVRGRAWVTTTQADRGADRPVDLVDRPLRGDPAQSIMGLGLHLRRDVAGLRLRRLRHRRVRATHCRLARVDFAPHGLRPRCA